MSRAYTQRAATLSLFVILFEIFFGRGLQVFEVRPDLFLIFIVFWAFAIDRRTAPLAAIGLGLVRDIFSTGFFGAETLSYFLAACLISLVSLKLDRQNFWIRSASCFIFSLIHFWIFSLILQCLDESESFLAIFGWASVFHALYTAVIASWLIGIFERWTSSGHSRISFNT